MFLILRMLPSRESDADSGWRAQGGANAYLKLLRKSRRLHAHLASLRNLSSSAVAASAALLVVVFVAVAGYCRVDLSTRVLALHVRLRSLPFATILSGGRPPPVVRPAAMGPGALKMVSLSTLAACGSGSTRFLRRCVFALMFPSWI